MNWSITGPKIMIFLNSEILLQLLKNKVNIYIYIYESPADMTVNPFHHNSLLSLCKAGYVLL